MEDSKKRTRSQATYQTVSRYSYVTQASSKFGNDLISLNKMLMEEFFLGSMVVNTVSPLHTRGPSYLHRLTLILACIRIYIHYKKWDTIIHSQTSKVHRWSLEKDKWFHPTLYWACGYLSMLGLRLIHISKRGPWWGHSKLHLHRPRQAARPRHDRHVAK